MALLSVVECAIQCPHVLWTMQMAFRQGLGKRVMMKSILTPGVCPVPAERRCFQEARTIRNMRKDGVSVAASQVCATRGVTCEKPRLVFLLGVRKNRMDKDVESRMSNQRKRSLSTNP